MMNTIQSNETQHGGPQVRFILWTVIAFAVATFAAWLSAAMGLEVWVMFVGFIAWFTRPTSLGNSVSAMMCLWLGVAIGAPSYVATDSLVPALDHMALPVVVSAVALIIVGLRDHGVLGNMLAWFLGMVTYFAAGPDFAAAFFVHLTAATAVGGAAGYSCQALNRRFAE